MRVSFLLGIKNQSGKAYTNQIRVKITNREHANDFVLKIICDQMVKKALENSEKFFPLPFGSPAIELENVTSGHIRAVLKFADFLAVRKRQRNLEVLSEIRVFNHECESTQPTAANST